MKLIVVNPIFIFSTPEGGGDEIKSILSSLDYNIASSFKTYPKLKTLFEFNKSCADRDFSSLGGEIIKKFFFKQSSGLWGFRDFYMSREAGGADFWLFLLDLVPESKIILCARPLEKNLARILAAQKWIPSYGKCPSSCEQALKYQILNQKKVSETCAARSLFYNPDLTSKLELIKFINDDPRF